MRGLGSGNVTCWPMRGLEINFTGKGQTDRHTDKHTDGHRNSMTESAQWADQWKQPFIPAPSTWSLKICHITTAGSANNGRHYRVLWFGEVHILSKSIRILVNFCQTYVIFENLFFIFWYCWVVPSVNTLVVLFFTYRGKETDVKNCLFLGTIILNKLSYY